MLYIIKGSNARFLFFNANSSEEEPEKEPFYTNV